MTAQKEIVLTGLRANNDLHIGNYFGAMLPMIDMAQNKSDTYQINMFVPDLHSFTTPIDHSQLQAQIMHNIKLFVAAGLDLQNENIYLYRQSYVPAHSELTWILDCFTSFGEMSRMTQFKDKGGKLLPKAEAILLGDELISELKSAGLHVDQYRSLYAKIRNTVNAFSHQSESVSIGLFNYPVLMAADILLYSATYVPVGDDQTQHLEFTRDIAERMNNKFGELFTIPKPVKAQHEFFGKDQGLRIKDLMDPTKKMSKSDDTGKGVIFLGDNPKAASKKIMGATTDSVGKVNFDWENQPGITNLLQILSLLSGKPQDEVNAQWLGRERYGELKKAVAQAVEQFLTEFQATFNEVDEAKLQEKLESSERAMNKVANATLLRAQQAVGLRPRG